MYTIRNVVLRKKGKRRQTCWLGSTRNRSMERRPYVPWKQRKLSLGDKPVPTPRRTWCLFGLAAHCHATVYSIYAPASKHSNIRKSCLHNALVWEFWILAAAASHSARALKINRANKAIDFSLAHSTDRFSSFWAPKTRHLHINEFRHSECCRITPASL